CALVTSTERESNCELAAIWEIDLASSCDVAIHGFLKLPIHFEIVHQVLPTITEADVTDGASRETGAACHDQVNVFALSVDEFDTADFRTPRRVVGAASSYVRSQQRVNAQLPSYRFIEYLQFCVHKQHR